MTQPGKRFLHGIDVTVYCTAEGFRDQPAQYKIAAPWTGGDVTELKTYGFANNQCLFEVYRQARESLLNVTPGEGETVGEIGVYLLEPNSRDADLKRLAEFDTELWEKWHSRQQAD